MPEISERDPIVIDIADQQAAIAADHDEIRRAIRAIITDAGYGAASISVALVDDATIHDINRRYLDHDYPTDVISFSLDSTTDYLEGEIVASAETAVAGAARHGDEPGAEMLLYIVHGALHLVGYDDHAPEQRRAMREQEARYLAMLGKTVHVDDGESEPDA